MFLSIREMAKTYWGNKMKEEWDALFSLDAYFSEEGLLRWHRIMWHRMMESMVWDDLHREWLNQAFPGESKAHLYIQNGVWREVVWSPEDEDEYIVLTLRVATPAEIAEGIALMEWRREICLPEEILVVSDETNESWHLTL